MAQRPTERASCEQSAAPDEQLLAKFIKGEEKMFAELVHRYEQPLYAFICRINGSPAAAPDLFQETFIRVFQSAGTFRHKSSFKTWLYRIAANVCRSHLRNLQRHRAAPVEKHSEGQHKVSPHPEEEAASREIGGCIAEAVQRLPEEQREVFILKAYDEMSYREIGEILLRPLGTVKSQMRLALAKLRVELQSIAEAYGLG